MKRDQILFNYVEKLPEKDLKFNNFSEYIKGLITKDMQQRAALLGIDISEIEDMREVSETTVSEPPVSRKKPKIEPPIVELEEPEEEFLELEEDPDEEESEKDDPILEEESDSDDEESSKEEPIDYRKMSDNFDF